MTVWQSGSYGAAKRHWFVWRKVEGQPQQQLEDQRGNVRWFATKAAADRAAKKANAT